MFGWLNKLRKALGKLTDVLIRGREYDLWNKGPQMFMESESAEVLKVSNGMSNLQAAIQSALVFIVTTVLQGADFSLLLTDPRAFGVSLFAAAVSAFHLYLQRPGQASVMLGSSEELRKEAERVSSLKIAVPLRKDGGE